MIRAAASFRDAPTKLNGLYVPEIVPKLALAVLAVGNEKWGELVRPKASARNARVVSISGLSAVNRYGRIHRCWFKLEIHLAG